MKIRFFAFKRLYSLVFWSIFSLSVVQCRTSDSREAPIAEQVPTHSGFALQDLGSAQRYYLSREPFLCQGSQFALSQALIPVENKLQRASVQDRALQFQVYEGLAALDPGLLVFLGHLKTRVILQDNIDRECGLKDARACWTQGVAETRIYLSPFYQQNFHGTVLNHLPVLQAAEILFDSVGELDDRFVRDPQDDFSKKVQELAVIAVTEYKNRYPEASVSILDAREVFAHLLFTASCNASWVEYTQANFPASFAALQTLQAQLRAVYQGESSYGLVHKGLRPSRLKLQSKDLLGGRTPVEESEEDLSKMISHALETPLGTPRGTRASKTIMGPEDVKAWTSPVSPLDDNLLTPRSMSREDSDRYAFRRGLPKLTDVRQQSEDKLVRTPISALIKGKTKCCAYEGTPLLVAPSKSAVYSAEGGTPSDVVTILVHGTFSPHAVTKANGWANPDGLFADHIRREWGGDVLSFMWTGKQDAKS
ncbi:MAG: hypothetical protein OXT67_14095, partial [Zetaproteobacteria bacterium]|nr:hypothetical protein [Zetaproteobacteria bacterium]